MTDLLFKLFIALFGVGGLLWAIIAARRKRPRLKLTVKGQGVHVESEPDNLHIYLVCKIDNLSSDSNSITEAHFAFLNTRESEYIWNAINVKFFSHDKASNYIGEEIGPALRVDGHSSIEFIAVLQTNREVVARYLGSGSMFRHHKHQEIPFQFRLILIDSNGNAFTGHLQSKKVMIINHRLLTYLSHKRTDLLNDNMYGRKRMKHLGEFYVGSLWFRTAYVAKRCMYELGLFAGTQ